MTCTEIEELAGAIALGAIPDDEWPAIRDHLATCARGHAEVRRLQPVATLLLEAAPPVEPPARLRERILAAARAESEPAPAPPARDAAARPATARAERRAVLERINPLWWRQPAWGAVAAALVLALALGVWNVMLRRDLNETQQRLAAEQRALAVLAGEGRRFEFAATLPGAGGIVLRPTSGPATLVVHGLPPATDTVYQVWALRGEQPASLGVFTPDEAGRRVVTLDENLSDVDAVAITVEPAPRGSRQPTRAPILVAPVRG